MLRMGAPDPGSGELLDALADGLHGLESVPGLRGVDADALCIPVVDPTENPDGPILHGLGHGCIGAPHLQRPVDAEG
jgi:hypothetical protein